MLPTHLTLGNTESIVQAVIEGIGPAFVSRMSAEPALMNHQVIEVAVEAFNPVQRLYMARHTELHGSDVRTVFWDFTFAPENDDLRPIMP
jgi:DNA-binding transcriptional LysR family regulator